MSFTGGGKHPLHIYFVIELLITNVTWILSHFKSLLPLQIHYICKLLFHAIHLCHSGNIPCVCDNKIYNKWLGSNHNLFDAVCCCCCCYCCFPCYQFYCRAQAYPKIAIEYKHISISILYIPFIYTSSDIHAGVILFTLFDALPQLADII